MVTNKQKEFIKEVMKRLKQKYTIEELNKTFTLVDWEKEEYKICKGYENIDIGRDYGNCLYGYLKGITSGGNY